LAIIKLDKLKKAYQHKSKQQVTHTLFHPLSSWENNFTPYCTSKTYF